MEFENINKDWSLDELYTSFDSEQFTEDFCRMRQDISETAEKAPEMFLSSEGAAEKIEWFIERENRFSKYYLLYQFASLTLAVNANDETAMKIKDRLMIAFTEFTKPRVLFFKYVASQNLDEIIQESEKLKEFEFYLKSIKENNKYLLSEAEEVVISKLYPTGSNAWGDLQSHLTSTLMVDIDSEPDGKTEQKPLTVIRNMAYSENAALRKRAYEAELKGYEKIDKSVAFALNSVKGEAIAIAGIRGYKSPLEMTLIEARMDEDILNALISSMEDFLPTLRRFYKKKAEMLGHKNGLPFYDLFAPIGTVDMRFTYEEAADFVVKNFYAFSEKLGDFAKNAFENRWIDAIPKEGKVGGAFCANIHAIKQSRILTNFDGSFGDVTTLAHELGHGYHGEMLKNEAFINTDYTMPIAETASTFCETIVTNAALKTVTDEEKKVILENMISDSLQVIIDIYSRFSFESEVFEKRNNGSLSVNEFKEMMLSAQKKAYGDGLDEKYLHPYMWLCKGHYYDARYNFYNFPYAYGLLFAKGLYAQYLNEGDSFIPKYDALLNATGKNSLADVGKAAGIDVSSKEFWTNSLKLIEKDVDMFCEM